MPSSSIRVRRQMGRLLINILTLLIFALLLIDAYKVSNLFDVDFLEYYAAGSVFLGGGNPYSPVDMFSLERQIGRRRPEALMMFNPPWTLAVLLPFCAFPYQLARALWVVSLAFILLLSANWLWKRYGGPSSHRWLSWLAVMLFFPSAHALILGQLSSIVLAGLIGFVSSIDRKQYLLAGFFCLPIALKPHLVFLFWLVLVLWSVREKCWMVLAGAGISLGGSTIILSIWRPELIENYISLIFSGQTLKWVTPTSGMLLRMTTDLGNHWIQFIPSVLGIVVVIYLWYFRWKSNFSWNTHIVPLILLSSITTFFAWTHDMTILLPCVLTALISFIKNPFKNVWILIVLLLVNLLYVGVLWFTRNSFFTLWMPWILSALYLYTNSRNKWEAVKL